MDIAIVYNRYLYPDCSQHNCVCKLLTNGLCLTCEKKVCICDELLNADWGQPLLSSLPMPSLPSDFDIITLSKAISVPSPKTYTAVVTLTLFSNNQIQNIKKVYDEKIAHLDKQLS
jgi:hypothetical protein